MVEVAVDPSALSAELIETASLKRIYWCRTAVERMNNIVKELI
jgi:hypothetical protein